MFVICAHGMCDWLTTNSVVRTFYTYTKKRTQKNSLAKYAKKNQIAKERKRRRIAKQVYFFNRFAIFTRFSLFFAPQSPHLTDYLHSSKRFHLAIRRCCCFWYLSYRPKKYCQFQFKRTQTKERKTEGDGKGKETETQSANKNVFKIEPINLSYRMRFFDVWKCNDSFVRFYCLTRKEGNPIHSDNISPSVHQKPFRKNTATNFVRCNLLWRTHFRFGAGTTF